MSKFIERAMSEEKPPNLRRWVGWGARKGRRLIYREKFWVDGGNQIWRNCYECEEEESSRWWDRAATAKLREPKHVRTRGTANKLQSCAISSTTKSS